MSTRSNSLRAAMPRVATATSQILERNQRPLTRGQLHRKAVAHVAEAVAATCLWDRSTEPPLGDYHLAAFVATLGGVVVTVTVKSWPDMPALMEVSSVAEDRRSQPSSPDVLRTMKAIGFTLDSRSGHYRRELRARSIRDVERTALLVLDIFHDAFNYRGLVPIDVEVDFGGRASEAFVYMGFAPQEIANIATQLGYSAQVVQPSADDAPAVTIVLRKGS